MPRDFLDHHGNFLVLAHHPSYRVRNLRAHDQLEVLGREADSDCVVDNRRNFPPGEVEVARADPVYEIPNPLTFRGVTYINRPWAEARAADPNSIRLPKQPEVSLGRDLTAALAGKQPELPAKERLIALLPRPLQLTLAATSTDPDDLTALAALSCDFAMGPEQTPQGLLFRPDDQRPQIHDHDLYETVANNPHLPSHYKRIMVLRPGAQGGSEIVGEYGAPGAATHIYEYLRRNSYIPWGHYAANMAEDAIRYRIADLTAADMTGLRHLYYQRTYVRLAELLDLPAKWQRTGLTGDELEELRLQLQKRLAADGADRLPFTGTLWGWNFGYDCSGSGYRLHASHQQVHQQYALVPPPPAFAAGDQVAACCRSFRKRHGQGMFAAYLKALRQNRRIDGRRQAPAELIIHEDEQLILFVPKAQASQWELQIMTKAEVGHVLEADAACRAALDRALLLAQQILAGLGATMVTSIEYSKRLDAADHDQRLLYALLPKLPYAMGAFTEAQQRFICGHYPEDFAACCRNVAGKLTKA
ncbi:hypothetical protein [Desulfurivibrio alkaliphilus]|uniref:Uncharacterized protein n=1 Tax=Desulfurivibrio alkaliphilus (strain DSM 19089 / UNIQEM U267 / AHT2) TaxID=589865 RepID=D6Z3D0_DESAT|nr:hypothetical protein [Desulfurivibrio alkaliphilus]ADH86055.1 conserved hypothetical protein [Desulfurivibrio alkaliphilus AHT 2]